MIFVLMEGQECSQENTFSSNGSVLKWKSAIFVWVFPLETTGNPLYLALVLRSKSDFT
jgi:hypothetical protein